MQAPATPPATLVIHETMKALGLHKVLAIRCWTEADFESVARSADFVAHDEDTSVAGFWLGRQPRWLHLASYVCTWVLRNLSSGVRRRNAPPGYRNAEHCRDGGKWDLQPRRVNLR